MEELKQFIDIMSKSFSSMSDCGFDLFRQSVSKPYWVIYACIHDGDNIVDIGGDFAIDKDLSFNDVLTLLVASGYPVKVHAYYFNDLY